MQGKYPLDWFKTDFKGHASLDQPGIYRWRIEGGKTYVGRFTRPSRPLKEYPKNVFRLLNGIPYRPKDPDGFRAVHRALAKAVQDRLEITLTILENCDVTELNVREGHWRLTVHPEHRLNGLRRERK